MGAFQIFVVLFAAAWAMYALWSIRREKRDQWIVIETRDGEIALIHENDVDCVSASSDGMVSIQISVGEDSGSVWEDVRPECLAQMTLSRAARSAIKKLPVREGEKKTLTLVTK